MFDRARVVAQGKSIADPQALPFLDEHVSLDELLDAFVHGLLGGLHREVGAFGAERDEQLVDPRNELRAGDLRPHSRGAERRWQHLVEPPDVVLDAMREGDQVAARLGV
jgi:hypothetical protein